MVNCFSHPFKAYFKKLCPLILTLILGFQTLGMAPALGAINDDRFDGNIFTLYASNGSLVPSRTSLAESLRIHRPTLLMFYVDDSYDCKRNVMPINQIQAFYTLSVALIPISVDTIDFKRTYSPNEEPYYYNGQFVPQWVFLDQDGQVVFDKIGQVTYDELDDVARPLLGLAPRPDDFSLGNPQDFSPSPSADATFWTAPVREIGDITPELSQKDET
jgi:hypothetical protein